MMIVVMGGALHVCNCVHQGMVTAAAAAAAAVMRWSQHELRLLTHRARGSGAGCLRCRPRARAAAGPSQSLPLPAPCLPFAAQTPRSGSGGQTPRPAEACSQQGILTTRCCRPQRLGTFGGIAAARCCRFSQALRQTHRRRGLEPLHVGRAQSKLLTGGETAALPHQSAPHDA